MRGNAGTHDLQLGTATLRALVAGETAEGGDSGGVGAAASTKALRIPRYDKSARGGRGDRAPAEEWEVLTRAPDVVLFEGWMAGFKPLPADAPVLSEYQGLPQVNERLGQYAAWHELMSAWIVLAVDDPKYVFDWRLQAEQAMAAEGRPGMSDAQVLEYARSCARARVPRSAKSLPFGTSPI